jgi:hypothetical protein
MRLHALALVAGLASTLAIPQAEAPAAPRGLYSTAAAFDAARGRLVVFGGYGAGGYSGETWEWDGAWHRVDAAGPDPRNWPVMVFDTRRNRLVLFGGDTRDRLFGDTWAYDGKAWTKLADGPDPRTGHGMAYDSARDRVVLFGGSTRRLDNGAPAPSVADTWEFDGRAWTKCGDSGPAGRSLFGIAYDASLQRTIVFGGGRMTAMPPPASDTLGDTWEWDGARWTEETGAGPAPRDHVSMAYDPAGRRIVLAGGANPAEGMLAETWQRVGKRWSRTEYTATPALAGHHVLFDARASRPLIFGGFASRQQPTASIWGLAGQAWTLLQGPPTR